MDLFSSLEEENNNIRKTKLGNTSIDSDDEEFDLVSDII